MTDTSAAAVAARAAEQLTQATAAMVTQGNIEAERAEAKKKAKAEAKKKVRAHVIPVKDRCMQCLHSCAPASSAGPGDPRTSLLMLPVGCHAGTVCMCLLNIITPLLHAVAAGFTRCML